MNWTFVYSILMLFITIKDSECLMIILEKAKEFCILKELIAQDVMKFSFIVSGNEDVEKSVSVKLYDIDRRVLYSNALSDNNFLSKGDGEAKVNSNSKTTYSLCFFNAKYKDTVVSFEIFTLSESGHILSLAKDGNILI